MATLARQEIESPSTLLDTHIPTPFPREQFLHLAVEKGEQEEDGVVINPFEDGVERQDVDENPFEREAGPSVLSASGLETPNTVALVRDSLGILGPHFDQIFFRRKLCLLSCMCRTPVSWP